MTDDEKSNWSFSEEFQKASQALRQAFAPESLRAGAARLPQWPREQYEELVAAVRFLSVLPFPSSTGPSQQAVGRVYPIVGSGYFPIVGWLLALLLSLLPWGLGSLLPILPLAALLEVVQVVLTGGLHLDGLMDTCDGLFGGRTRERKLAIMRDSRVGSFGVLAGSSAMLLKFTLLASIGVQLLPTSLLIVLPLARWAMVLAVCVFPPVRSSGLGHAFRQTITPARLLLAGLSAFVIVLLVGHLVGALLWTLATLTALLLGAWVTRILGGLTGDVYGAIEEVTEILLFFFLLFLRTRL